MDLDMEIIYGSEEYEELQEYFETRKMSFPNETMSMQQRLKLEYIPERSIGGTDEENSFSNRRKNSKRVWGLLEEVSSDE